MNTPRPNPAHSGKPGLIVVSAPSGAGKTTLCARLLGEFADRLQLSISTTTRAPRGGERHGVEYFFMPKADFQKRITEGAFVEWAEVHGNFYGTSRQQLDEALARGRSLLLDIDVQGASSLRTLYPHDSLLIFVSPPDLATLEARLRGRGTDTEETIQKRLRNAHAELARAPEFDCTVVNDALDSAYAKLKASVQAFWERS